MTDSRAAPVVTGGGLGPPDRTPTLPEGPAVLLLSNRPQVVPDHATGDAAAYTFEPGEPLEVPDYLAAHLLLIEGFSVAREDGEVSTGTPAPGHQAAQGWEGVTRPPLTAPAPEDTQVRIVDPASATDPSTIVGPVETRKAPTTKAGKAAGR